MPLCSSGVFYRVNLVQKVLQEKQAQLDLRVLQGNLAQRDFGVFLDLW